MNGLKPNAMLIVDKKVLPDVYEKVLYATALLESGEAKNISQAVKLAGISRSVYYKYKDSILPYIKEPSKILTMQVILMDRPGALMHFIEVFYQLNANILTIYQSLPMKDRAFVTVSVRMDDIHMELEEFLTRIKKVNGVIKVESVVD